ncbi:hypothetical protein [Bradyrhizobium ottawaense]
MPDLVVPHQMRHLALDVSCGDPVGCLRDIGEPPDHGVAHDEDVDRGKDQRRESKHE